MVVAGVCIGIVAGLVLYAMIGTWLNGYYDSKNDDPYSDLSLLVGLFWPVMLPARLMFPLFNFALRSGKSSGLKQLEAKKIKLAQLKKIRIETEAAMKEVDDEMKALEGDPLYQYGTHTK